MATLMGMALITTGCGKDDRLATYTVTGKVVFSDGAPLEGGTIIFESIDRGLGARGVIELDGTFHLGTYETDDGAVAGRYRVAIVPDPPMNVDPDEVKLPPVIDSRYADMDASGLEYEVRADGPNEFHIQVDRPNPR